MSRYLLRAGIRRRGPNSVVIAEELEVEHPTIMRRAEVRETPIGLIGRLESTGRRDRRRLHFIVTKGTVGTGAETSRSRHQAETQASAAATKMLIRELRPQDAEKIDGLDEELAAVEERRKALCARREEAVHQAFSRGHVVRLSQLTAMAATYEREWEKARAEERRER
jgi:hypothetical protein